MRRVQKVLSGSGAVALVGALAVIASPVSGSTSGAAEQACTARPEAGT